MVTVHMSIQSSAAQGSAYSGITLALLFRRYMQHTYVDIDYPSPKTWVVLSLRLVWFKCEWCVSVLWWTCDLSTVQTSLQVTAGINSITPPDPDQEWVGSLIYVFYVIFHVSYGIYAILNLKWNKQYILKNSAVSVSKWDLRDLQILFKKSIQY